MINTVRQYLNGAIPELMRRALINVLDPAANLDSCGVLNSAGLTTNTALVKTGSGITYAIVNRVFLSIAGSTNMPALVGTVKNATYGAFFFYTDQNGNLTTLAATPGATLAAMKMPATPINKALIGIMLINPTGTGDFVGGTTSLTDGTVVPNAVFINTTATVDPTISVRG